jgi:hypothetical protein
MPGRVQAGMTTCAGGMGKILQEWGGNGTVQGVREQKG